jgi:ABC-2 type transport system permease protein
MSATSSSLFSARTLAVGRGRVVIEMKNLWRSRQQFGFTIVFPVMMLLLFASIFSGRVEGTGVALSQVYVAGILGSSLMSTGFVALAIGLAVERDSGTLDRLAGTPMPKASYFLGKVGMVLVTVALQAVILIGIGVVLFDLPLPSRVGSWLTFAWVFLLGVSSSALLGIAVGGMIADAKSAAAVVNLPFVALQFISGVWIGINLLPMWLVRVSQVFPLHWICRGMRSVFLPDNFATVEADGAWQLGTTALVLGGWCILGFVLCARTFRWTRR